MLSGSMDSMTGIPPGVGWRRYKTALDTRSEAGIYLRIYGIICGYLWNVVMRQRLGDPENAKAGKVCVGRQALLSANAG